MPLSLRVKYLNGNDLHSYVLMLLEHKLFVVYFKTHIYTVSIIYGLGIDSHNDQLPVGLIAQLLGHCTAVTEVRI